MSQLCVTDRFIALISCIQLVHVSIACTRSVHVCTSLVGIREHPV